MVTSILIADDHTIVRQGICSLIAGQADMTVVAEAADGFSAVELAAEFRPDVIIMDVSMPRMDGVEATRQILAAGEGSWIIHCPVDTSGQVQCP
jgi:DNA-binding NarL/FixJ family response regulator